MAWSGQDLPTSLTRLGAHNRQRQQYAPLPGLQLAASGWDARHYGRRYAQAYGESSRASAVERPAELFETFVDYTVTPWASCGYAYFVR